MGRRRMGLVAALLALIASGAASADGRVSIQDIRWGEHADYDRIVVELDAPTLVRWQHDPDPDAVVFEIAAKPERSRQIVATGRDRIGQMRVAATSDGTRLTLQPRPRRTRAFLLGGPPRLVIDVADPGPERFDAPGGANSISKLPPPVAKKPARPVARPTPEVRRPRINREPASKPAPVAVAPTRPEAPVVTDAKPETPVITDAKPETPVVTEARPELAVVVAEPEPKPAAPSVPLVEPEPDVAAAQPLPSTSSPRWRAWLAALVAVLALAAGIGLTRLRTRSDLDESRESQDDPAGIHPVEPDGYERLGLLELRLDEEVRARMQLEQRLSQADDEISFLRERLHWTETNRG